MANFDVQIQALAGTATNSEMNQWMMDGAREIINILPPHLKEYCYSKQTFTSNAANSEAETMITGQLGSVYAGSVECRQIRPMDKHKASSSTSIEYASATDPVFYIEGGKINVLPASSAGVYYVIANPNITASDASSIDNFPNEAEYLVVLYASIKVLQNKMNEKSSSLPSDVSEINLSIVGSSLPVYTSPSGIVVPASLSDVDIDFSSIGSKEDYIVPVFAAPDWNTFDDLSLPVPPSAPESPSFTYSDVSVNDIVNPIISISDKASLTASAPTYSKPSIVAPSWPTFDSMDLPSAPIPPALESRSIDISSLTAPTYTMPLTSLDYDDADNWINTEEDNEMLGARMQVINAKINELNANMTNAVNKYNKELEVFKTDVDVTQKNTSFENENDKNKLSKYNVEVTEYQQSVNKEIQRWTNEEYNAKVQEYTSKYQYAIQQYAQDIQNEANEYTKEIAIYNEDIQRKSENFQKDANQAIKNAEIELQTKSQNLSKESTIALQNALKDYEQDVAEYTAKIQKYSQELDSYKTQSGVEVQKWVSEEYNVKIQEYILKYSNGLQEYASDIQNQSLRVDLALKNYQAEVQKAINKYQVETGYDLSKSKLDLEKEVARFSQDLAKNTQEFASNIQKYSSEVSKVASDNQNKISKYGQDLVNYQAKIQKHSVDYSWYEKQYAQLKLEYNQGMQILTSGGMPQQKKGDK